MSRQLYVTSFLLVIVLTTMAFFSCNKKNIFETAGEEFETKDMQVVRLDKNSAVLQLNESVELTPSFFPSVANPLGGFSWKNDNPDVVEMQVANDFSVTLKGKAVGTAKISVVSGEGKSMAVCEVLVSEPQVPQITLSTQQATLLVGDEFTVSPVVSPPVKNPEKYFAWQIDDSDVAALTVNSDFTAKVIAKKTGQATLSVMNKQNSQLIASMLIKVEDDVVVGALKEPIQVSFGSTDGVPAAWNPLPSPAAGTTINDLIDKEGDATGVSISIMERFNGTNTDGSKTTTTDLDMPAAVSGSSYYGNSFGAFGGAIVEKSVLLISGLNEDLKYDFCFFGSRSASDNRDTKFIVAGSTTDSSSINTASNSNRVACVNGVSPDADGLIRITITAGDNNNNATGFYYLGAMRIKSSD